LISRGSVPIMPYLLVSTAAPPYRMASSPCSLMPREYRLQASGPGDSASSLYSWCLYLVSTGPWIRSDWSTARDPYIPKVTSSSLHPGGAFTLSVRGSLTWGETAVRAWSHRHGPCQTRRCRFTLSWEASLMSPWEARRAGRPWHTQVHDESLPPAEQPTCSCRARAFFLSFAPTYLDRGASRWEDEAFNALF
jgi:hypothetical protein